jgi:hypothetical protein
MSETRVFDLGDAARVLFKGCSSDLRIQGVEGTQAEFLVPTNRDGLHIEPTEQGLQVSSSISLAVRVPQSTRVALQSCSGDARVTKVGELQIGQHHGDLVVMQVGSAELEALNGDVQVGGTGPLRMTTVNGDLHVSAAQGELVLVGIRGDVRLQAIKGQAELHNVTGDISIRNLDGQLDVHDVNGDVELSANLRSGEYAVEANGDIRLRLDHSSDALIELEAPLGSISSSLKLSESQQSAHALRGTLGQGTARVRIFAVSGDIKARAVRSSDMEEALNDEIARVEECAQRAAARAQRMAEKMRRRSERIEERARRRAERVAGPHIDRTLPRRQRASSGVVQQERMAVLTMLSEGKINAEQAEALLAALEG